MLDKNDLYHCIFLLIIIFFSARVVSSYLIHHGYSSTAEAFAKTTGEPFREDLTSIKNRQKILKLVMTGRMGQAIEQTIRSFRGVLENNQNLLFMLKCRQFIEMVNGSDIEVCHFIKTDTDFRTIYLYI